MPRESTRHLASTGQVAFQLAAFGSEELHVAADVPRNIFAPGFRNVVAFPNGTLQDVTVDEGISELACIFVGDGSFVSTCGGDVRGKAWSKVLGDWLHFEPAGGDADEHVVYRERDLQEAVAADFEGRSCGITRDNVAAFKFNGTVGTRLGLGVGVGVTRPRENDGAGAGDSNRRRLASERVVEVLVVNDAKRYADLGGKVHGHSAFISGLVNDAYRDFPGEQSISIRVAGMLTFTDGDGWTNEAAGSNGAAVAVNKVLRDFQSWVSANRAKLPPHDVAHLLSGHDLHSKASGHGVIGLAYIGTACGKKSNTGVTQANFVTSAYVANTMAHELAHNLGVEHTSEPAPLSGATCDGDGAYNVMDGSSRAATATWSACSAEWVAAAVASGDVDCTAGDDLVASEDAGGLCGNGVLDLDAGEECDCLHGECDEADPCCEASTCTLRAGAQCSALHEACCDPDTCAPRRSTDAFVCRPSASEECDVAETCDGASAACPADAVASAAATCGKLSGPARDGSTDRGRCFLGECHDRDEQCVDRGFEGACDAARCGFLRCARSVGEEQVTVCYNIAPHTVEDGTPCDGEAGDTCFQGDCVLSSALPESLALAANNCSNGVFDKAASTETALDCGGDCLPCPVGSACERDDDCAFPGSCDEALRVCIDSYDENDGAQTASSWLLDNSSAVAVILVVGAVGAGLWLRFYVVGPARERRHRRRTDDCKLASHDEVHLSAVPPPPPQNWRGRFVGAVRRMSDMQALQAMVRQRDSDEEIPLPADVFDTI